MNGGKIKAFLGRSPYDLHDLLGPTLPSMGRKREVQHLNKRGENTSAESSQVLGGITMRETALPPLQGKHREVHLLCGPVVLKQESRLWQKQPANALRNPLQTPD